MSSNSHVAVVGAGSFGGWTALHLLERGARVTLIDAWGPGNSRASSGGETRIMRATYGPNQPYTELATRAMSLWRKYEQRWSRQFLHRCGVLWMVASADDAYERESIPELKSVRVPFENLLPSQIKKRWSQINLEDVRWGIFEPQSGYLDARASCQAVAEAFIKGGGEYRQAEVLSSSLDESPVRSISCSDGASVRADAYVFACGPWLGKLFPKSVGNRISATKQEVFFFGPPVSNAATFTDAQLPVWGDHGERFFYGIPGSDRRGFKIADDTRGPEFDPTNGERVVSSENLKRVREYVAHRFPALKDAPLLETRVCQYEQTPDGDFIVDRHPHNDNVWILGGGSGHGFKHGPAIGELMAGLILDGGEPNPRWKLSRFAHAQKP